MDWQTIIFQYIPVTTIATGVIAYFGKYFFERYIQKQNKRLEYLNRQLNDFYGPLYTLTKAGKNLMDNFINHVIETNLFPIPCIGNENTEWRLWIEEVFTPLNKKIENIILENGYLINDDIMPDYFLDFLVHSAQYKIIINKWKLNDFTVSFAEKVYPPKLLNNIEFNFLQLKKNQVYIREKLLNLQNITKSENSENVIRYPGLKGTVDLRFLTDLERQVKNSREDKEYFTALYYLFLYKEQVEKIKKQSIIDKYHYQLWKDYEGVVCDFQKYEQETFCLYADNKIITGIINYKIEYICDVHGDIIQDKTKNKQFLFENSDLKNPIEKVFTLYEEVKLIETLILEKEVYDILTKDSYVSHNEITKNTANPYIFKIHIKDDVTGWIDGRYLWFYPSYMKKDKKQNDIGKEETNNKNIQYKTENNNV